MVLNHKFRRELNMMEYNSLSHCEAILMYTNRYLMFIMFKLLKNIILL